jgi:transglutaminase-like putative cysteine protease
MTNLIKSAFLLICLGAGTVGAQPVFDKAAIEKMYAGEDVCVLDKSEHITIRTSGDQLKIESYKSSDMLFLSDKASMFLNKSIFYYDHFSDIRGIQANSWIPDGEKYKKLKVSEINTRKTKHENVFYDDLMEAYFVYPSLRKGAISSLQYYEDIHDPHFLGEFYFASYSPTEKSEFRVTFPGNVKVRYVIRNNNGTVSFREEKSKNSTTYVFSGGRNKGSKMEDSAPDDSYFLPHVIVHIESYTVDGKEKKVLADVDGLYSWYRELMGRMKLEDHESLKVIADSLTKGLTTDREKIRKVYYWVQDEIRYIAFEEGLGGFIPREPIDTYNKRFGDCKDKAMLLNAILKEAGIKSYPVWIGTRDIPYTYKEVPTPMVDNHMISAVEDEGRWIFMDATTPHLAYGLPSSMIQGKEALIGLTPQIYRIEKVPEAPRGLSVHREHFTVTLDKGTITGKGISSVTGYPSENLYIALEQYTGEKRTDFLNRYLGLGNGKYTADKIALNPGYMNRDSSIDLTFDFKLFDFVTEVDDQVFVNLQLKKPAGFEKFDIDKRQHDQVVEYRATSVLETVFDIPKGYEVVSIPKGQEVTDPRFGFKITYKTEQNRITLTRELYIDTLTIKTSDFADWNSAAAKLADASKELIILKKTRP